MIGQRADLAVAGTARHALCEGPASVWTTGRHWRIRFVPLNRMTEVVPAAAARWAGPESTPRNSSARSSRAVVSPMERRPVQSHRPGWGRMVRESSTSSAPPTMTTRQPSARKRSMRRCQCRMGQRLASGASAQVNGQERNLGGESAGVQAIGLGYSS